MRNEIFRSQAMRIAGWAWMVFAAANFVDIAWRGRDRASLVSAAVLLLGCGIAYAVALRPRIAMDESALRIVNLLRDIVLPWGAIERIKGTEAVLVFPSGAPDKPFRAWVMQSSPRARAKLERRAQRDAKRMPDAVADYVKDRTPTDFVVEQLNESLEDHRRKRDGEEAQEPAVTWAYLPIAALVLPAAFLLLAIFA